MATVMDGPRKPARQAPAPGQRRALVLGIGGVGALIAAAAAIALIFSLLPDGDSGSKGGGSSEAIGLHNNGQQGPGANGQGAAGSNQANGGQAGKPNPNGSPNPGSSQSPGASGSPKPHGKSGGAPDGDGGDGGGGEGGSTPKPSSGGGASVSSFSLSSSSGTSGGCYTRTNQYPNGMVALVDARFTIKAGSSTKISYSIYDDDYALKPDPGSATGSYSTTFHRMVSEPGWHKMRVVVHSPGSDSKTISYKVCSNS
jgi:hypothetical protein